MGFLKLKPFLDNQFDKYHRPEFLRLDPLVCLQGFSSRGDLEVAGLIAAVLAYGRAEIIIRNVSRIFERTGRDLVTFSAETSLAHKRRLFQGFKHRFTDGDTIAALLQGVGEILQTNGSLESLFAQGLKPEDITIRGALAHFTEKIRRQATRSSPGNKRSVQFLLSSPESGSACKRMNMYLRWMVRKNDGVDLGVWKSIPASKLVMPVDTHVARISRSLGLTRRATADWAMAEEITSRLRTFDKEDPIRYDFSLCRAGMIDFRRRAA
jgi:uncharacterized protein (TIGR02757 family)